MLRQPKRVPFETSHNCDHKLAVSRPVLCVLPRGFIFYSNKVEIACEIGLCIWKHLRVCVYTAWRCSSMFSDNCMAQATYHGRCLQPLSFRNHGVSLLLKRHTCSLQTIGRAKIIISEPFCHAAAQKRYMQRPHDPRHDRRYMKRPKGPVVCAQSTHGILARSAGKETRIVAQSTHGLLGRQRNTNR